jgi:DNA polymerase-3 subunit beta
MVKVSVKAFKDALIYSVSDKNFPDVLIKASGSVVYVRSVNYDCYLSFWFLTNQDNDFEVLVDKKQLLTILKAVKSDTISLFKQNEDLVVSTDKATYRLKSKDPSIFTSLGLDKNTDDCIYLNFKKLTTSIDKLIYAVSKDKSYSYEAFKTVGFIFKDNYLYITGTDGSRLAICKSELTHNLNRRFGIPKSAILHLKKMWKHGIEFGVVDDVAIFKTDTFLFATRINDEYPDALSVIEGYKQHLAIEVKLSKQELVDILKSFLTDKKDVVKLTLTENNLNLLSSGNEANLSIDYKGDKYEISFNTVFLLEALENMCSDEIILKLPLSHDNAVYLEPVDSDCECLALLMPVA